MPRRRASTAFTILEMLVAVAATFILVLFLSQIFSSMSGGVSLGMATSDVIQSNLTFSRQVGDDASKMPAG
jgi:Tfp pilus assembly protein FimT